MNDVICRVEGRVGRITLNRPKALNALTHDMCLEIETALDHWHGKVSLVIIDAEGDKAFCAGGDVTKLYESALRGDIAYGRKFWQDEYRLNAKLSEYPVPIASFLQGFVMGGGVGLGCHVSHRIVCESTKIAMPECSIGLMPDVGGSLLLANAPEHLGIYLGLTGARMSAGDAIYTGFADRFIPYDKWEKLKEDLVASGNIALLEDYASSALDSQMKGNQAELNSYFAKDTVADIAACLKNSKTEIAKRALAGFDLGAPLAMACCFEALGRLKDTSGLRDALELEFRFTSRSVEQGDFPEGVRAAIIDKDNAPKWAHSGVEEVTETEVSMMLSKSEFGDLNLEW